MNIRSLLLTLSFVLGIAATFPLCAETPGTQISPVIPIIPPSVAKITPAGMKRGSTANFMIEGRNLSNATQVIFDAPGISGTVTEITDVPEQIAPPRAGEDLGAQVPQGRKQTARMEIKAEQDALPGVHRFRIKTPLGTTNSVAFAVGTLPEIRQNERAAMPDVVTLPATLIGNIAAPGDKDNFRFEGKAGEDTVFEVQASQLGSRLNSMLELRNVEGQILEVAGKNDVATDAVLHFRLPQDGSYTISITDRNHEGGSDYYYRLNAGPLPYITGVFPLGVRAGSVTEVSVKGVNLGDIRDVKFEAPPSAESWTTMPLAINLAGLPPLNEVKLAASDEPQILEQEPNNTVAQAQAISLPVTINGHIDGGVKADGHADEDYFRFHAHKGEQLSIDVVAARLGSSLDSVIEVLDIQGNAVPRATIRCLNQTTTTLADRDSRTVGIRLVSTADLREGDYLMVGDELDRIDFIPDQPDADTILKGSDDLRLAYLGTSPDVHAVNTPVYKAQILPPNSDMPSNGLPVFHLAWRNDDGGPGYGADSKLDFIAPADGEYILHIQDVRSMEGPDFSYRLTIRDATPNFRLKADPANPNIPLGGSTTMTVSVVERRGNEAPIAIEVKGLPQGISAAPATIQPGQDSTVVVLSAAADAPLNVPPTPIQVIGRSTIDGHELIRIANRDGGRDPQLQIASITPPPDVVVTTDARQVSIEPGKEVTVTLHVDRHNSFKGRVPCFVQNLPPGVRVVNVGLNGVLVTEAQTSRTFTLRAEEWAKPIEQPIYVVGMVESNSPTLHPSAPLLLKIAPGSQSASANRVESH